MILTTLTINRLDELKADFGGSKSLSHPKMAPYIKSQKKGVYYFDLDKTLTKLESLLEKLKIVEESGKKILFVATASRIRDVVGKFIAKTNHFYIDHRWLGGTLTNFEFIQKRIFLLQEMYNQEKKGIVESWPKKERFKFQARKATLELNLKGILEMKTLPDYLFIVSPKLQKNALKEAQKLNIPVFALCKSDSDPSQFVEFAPINDGSIPVLEVIMQEMIDLCFQTKETPDFEIPSDDEETTSSENAQTSAPSSFINNEES